MNKQQKKFIIGTIIFIIILTIGMLILTTSKKENTKTNTQNVNKEEYTIQQTNGDKINTSEMLKTARNELTYYIKNITLQKKGVQTIFKIDIENKRTIDMKGQLVDIVFIDKNGIEESRMALYIREIKAGETITTQATINNDFTNVYNFKLEQRNN